MFTEDKGTYVTKPGPSSLDIAQATLLTPFGVDEGARDRVFGHILAHRADDADLFFQYNRSESWSLEEGQVKSGSFSIDQGVGVRVVAGEKTAFAYADDITPAALEAAANVTRAIAAQGGAARRGTAVVRAGHALYAPIDPMAQFDDAEKVRILEALERHARAADPRVKQVMARLSGEYDVVLVARADGGLAADVRPLVHLSVTVIAEQDGRREQGHQGAGGRFGYGFYTDAVLERLAADAVRQALVNLESRPAPAGVMSVVLGPGWPGILLHEAIGHGLEGDFNRKGTSGLQRARGPARGRARRDRHRRRHHSRPPRLAQRRRRGQSHLAQRPDRGRHPARLPAGPPQRAPHGHGAHRQRPARVLRAASRCRA